MGPPLYPTLYAPSEGYVFLVTYGRSGSTLTQRLLNSIPGYCIRGENGNLTYFLSKVSSYVRDNENYVWRREDILKPEAGRHSFLQDILGTAKDPWYGAENVDPDAMERALMDMFVNQVLRPGPGCRVCGFKEIRFHEDPAFFTAHLETLRRAFPNSRFLFQTRDHAAVANSSWWSKLPAAKIESILSRAETLFRSFSVSHPECCFTIQYEKFAAGISYVTEIFDFLGEVPDPERVQEILGHRLRH
ncbi:sulfotransferase [Antarcticimicrobium luteum]|uniref:Sulfotransferase n=1 Tax=Antarcticimicrobium luteum TaxID=2547397 RepID=A0A4R5VGH3_9RHOB|nr:sulfotransferase [Antarcticimicrobium luteum]TDK50903.1 sulfotransferase [Antarcticimicrobium luteum]